MSNSANIFGAPGGSSLIFGNSPTPGFPPQVDFITAFGALNVIFSEGDNDTINSTGTGNSQVHLGGPGVVQFTGLTDVVDIGGSGNTVDTNSGITPNTNPFANLGLTNSAITVQNGTGENTVNLVNAQTGVGIAQNTVTLSEQFNNITVNANATNVIDSGDGNGHVTATASDGTGFTSFITPAEHAPAQFAAVTAARQPGQLLRRMVVRAREG